MNGEHAPARILAIDDSEDMRDYYEAELELAGYSVVVAADGKEGLDLARELRPDLIITDVSMPEMDGLELLVRLRSDSTPPLPPIIVCSGFDMTASTALRLGAFRFLPKPLDRAKLLAVISLALQGAGASEETVEQEKERIHQARKRASAAAKAALQAVDFGAPDVATGLRGFADWIADYYGFGATAITFVDGGDLRVRAVSRGSSIATGTVFDGRALYSSGVLASGASLVISDAAAYPFAGERARQFGIRSFVGVPLASNGIPVGTICLFDAVPRIFGAEDSLDPGGGRARGAVERERAAGRRRPHRALHGGHLLAPARRRAAVASPARRQSRPGARRARSRCRHRPDPGRGPWRRLAAAVRRLPSRRGHAGALQARPHSHRCLAHARRRAGRARPGRAGARRRLDQPRRPPALPVGAGFSSSWRAARSSRRAPAAPAPSSASSSGASRGGASLTRSARGGELGGIRAAGRGYLP